MEGFGYKPHIVGWGMNGVSGGVHLECRLLFKKMWLLKESERGDEKLEVVLIKWKKFWPAFALKEKSVGRRGWWGEGELLMGQDPYKDRRRMTLFWVMDGRVSLGWRKEHLLLHERRKEGMYNCESRWIFNGIEGIHVWWSDSSLLTGMPYHWLRGSLGSLKVFRKVEEG